MARKSGRPRSLELEIEARAVGRDDFAEQQCATITQLRREMTELVPGIGERARIGPFGPFFARKEARQLLVGDVRYLDSDQFGTLGIEYGEIGSRRLVPLGWLVKTLPG